MTKKLIKKTTSLSPISNRKLPAEVILEDGKVYLEKQDENGKEYKALIEPDHEFYSWMTSQECTEQVKNNAILMYVSNRCNLNCPVCYEYGNISREPSLAEIEEVLSGRKLTNIVLMGKEPTCREDIFEIIKLASKDNFSVLLTNGVKLADYDYTVKLKEAGLEYCTISFNGFDDRIYEEMNGKPLLDIKLRALENLKKMKIKTEVSVTLNRGTNEAEVKKIFDYCFDNQSFIIELRLRTTSRVGSHLDVDNFTMSELIELVSRALNIPKKDLYKEQAFWTEFAKEMDYLIPHNLRTWSRARLCCFYFHVTKEADGYSCFGGGTDIDTLKKSRIKKARLLFELIKNYGVRQALESANSFLKIADYNLFSGLLRPQKHQLLVTLRSWPNILNIDLEENKKCPSQYYKDGRLLPFCYSNILTDKVADRKADKEQTTE